jgi:hypothetical protein
MTSQFGENIMRKLGWVGLITNSMLQASDAFKITYKASWKIND